MSSQLNTELVTPSGIILPATSSIMPEGVERRPTNLSGADQQDTWLKAAAILGETVLAIKGVEKAGWTAVTLLASIKDILKKQYDQFTQFFATMADQRQDQAYGAAKDTPNVTRDYGDDVGGGRMGIGYMDTFFRGIVTAFTLLLIFIAASFRNKIMDAMSLLTVAFTPITVAFDLILKSLKFFGRLVGRLGQWISIAAALMSGSISTGLDWILTKFQSFVGALDKVKGMIGSKVTWITSKFSFFGELFSKIGEFISPVTKVIGTVLTKVMKLARIFGLVVMFFDFIEGFLTGFSSGGNFYTAMREGFLNIVVGILNIPKVLLSLLAQLFGMDALVPKIEEYSDLLVNGFIDGLRTIIDFLVLLPYTVGEKVKSWARGMLNAIGATDLANSSALTPSAAPTFTTGGGKVSASGPVKNQATPTTAKDPVKNQAMSTTAGLESSAKTAQMMNAGAKEKGASGAPIVINTGSGSGGGGSPTVNASKTNVYSTPNIPLNTRNQEPVWNRISDVTFAHRG